MKKFRLPRKTKKKLRKIIWLYPPKNDGSSLMAWPSKSQEDYYALKNGIVKDILEEGRNKKESKEFWNQLNKEVTVSDETLKDYVDDIIRKDLRNSFYNILLEAKKTPKAKISCYNFVNAYQIYENGDSSYGNICCMAVDKAKELLKT